MIRIVVTKGQGRRTDPLSDLLPEETVTHSPALVWYMKCEVHAADGARFAIEGMYATKKEAWDTALHWVETHDKRNTRG